MKGRDLKLLGCLRSVRALPLVLHVGYVAKTTPRIDSFSKTWNREKRPSCGKEGQLLQAHQLQREMRTKMIARARPNRKLSHVHS